MEPMLYDMHCHLDFFRDPVVVAHDAAEMGLGFFANTVTPDGYARVAGSLGQEPNGYARAVGSLGQEPNVHVGVGLHPWWVADSRCGDDDIGRAAELARAARFVGEIGLDFSPKHVPEGSQALQIAAFEQVARACAETSEPAAPKVLSVHSVRAATDTLDILKRTGCLERCRCIFHWFSGTSDELHRAVRADCFFSINEMMLRTRRGREYARQLPAKKLLLETDLPEGEDALCTAADVRTSLQRTLDQLCGIRGTELQGQILENSQLLLDGSQAI